MEHKSLKKLILSFNDSDLTNFSYKNSNFSVNISKNNNDITLPSSYDEIACTEDNNSKLSVNNSKEHFITSKYVGKFKIYNEKTSSYFVEKGQYVKKGSLLCIIEYLNIDIQITAPVSGVICDIKANDKDIVDYGQVLFIISV